jgi:hypothetical protein
MAAFMARSCMRILLISRYSSKNWLFSKGGGTNTFHALMQGFTHCSAQAQGPVEAVGQHEAELGMEVQNWITVPDAKRVVQLAILQRFAALKDKQQHAAIGWTCTPISTMY